MLHPLSPASAQSFRVLPRSASGDRTSYIFSQQEGYCSGIKCYIYQRLVASTKQTAALYGCFWPGMHLEHRAPAPTAWCALRTEQTGEREQHQCHQLSLPALLEGKHWPLWYNLLLLVGNLIYTPCKMEWRVFKHHILLFFLAHKVFRQFTLIDLWRVSWKLHHVTRFISMSIFGLSVWWGLLYLWHKSEKEMVFKLSYQPEETMFFKSWFCWGFFQMKRSQLTINISYFAS